jgi:hypothetical protein
MRTIEITIVILILGTAFIAANFFAVLPSPRKISSPNLRELALTALQALDVGDSLTETVFQSVTDPSWSELEIALAASLPPNIAYNLSVYDTIRIGEVVTYRRIHSITNAQGGLGTDSETASYLVTSPNTTYTVNPQRIARTLYILNCSDSNGWWITGYTGQTLATDLEALLAPYYNTTIVVQNTTDLGELLDGNTISGSPHENVAGATIVNTFGEAVPIPATYSSQYSLDAYAEYCYELGKRVNQHNWTWVSIVGYPFYYVSNTVELADSDNSWGIYGMQRVDVAGLNAFLQGLDVEHHPSYDYDGTWITGSPGIVYFSPSASYFSNYYGMYPSHYQTATRALPSWIQETYHVTEVARVFSPEGGYHAATTFKHESTGALTAIGLTRTPDVRVTALALLMYYHPIIFRTELSLSGDERPTQRLVILQLSLLGGT